MARQKLPPPSAASDSDTSYVDGDSSSDGEHVVSQQPQTPSAAKTATTNPSKRQDDSEEGEEEEEVEVEVEEVPPSKKVKLSAAPSQPQPQPQPQPPSKKSSQRIWDLEDEKALIEALSDHLAKNGELPPRKYYASFLSIMNRIPFNDAQMHNKIRHMRHRCSRMKVKGKKRSGTSSSTSLDEMWAELFAAEKEKEKEKEKKPNEREKEKGSSKASKKHGSLKIGGTPGSVAKGVMATGVASSGRKASDGAGNGGGVDVVKANDDVGNAGGANGVEAGDGVGNGGDVAGSTFYLEHLIKDMISKQQCPWCFTVEDVVVRIGASNARELEVKAMILSHDAMKLSARKLTLEKEVLENLIDDN